MYYLEFINTFIVLSVKLCECVNRLSTSILDLIKQIINNASHNIVVKCIFWTLIFHFRQIFMLIKFIFIPDFYVGIFVSCHISCQREIGVCVTTENKTVC